MRSTPDEDPGKPEPSVDLRLIEEWALAYLGRYTSSAENLRQVLLRRMRGSRLPSENSKFSACRGVGFSG